LQQRLVVALGEEMIEGVNCAHLVVISSNYPTSDVHLRRSGLS
jgi:hypothetical protein